MSQADNIPGVPAKQDDLRKMYRAAKKMVALGWQLFPLHRIDWTEPPSCPCGDDECDRVGKHPMFMWATERVTDNAGVMREWFDHIYRGIGLVTGAASGVWVLDIDTKGNGAETLAALEAKHTPLPKTVTSLTGSGGKHYFFKYPGPEYRNTARRLGPGLDSRGDGGYAVVPPTMHKSGNSYVWENSPFDTPLADVPPWLLDLARVSVEIGQRELPRDLPASSFEKCTEAEATARVEALQKHPLFIWASENPELVLWEMWRGLAQNLAAVTEGHATPLALAEEAFQQLSDGHPGYRRDKTSKVFRDAAHRVLVEIPKEGHGGPISFTRMLEQGNIPAELIGLDDGPNLCTFARREQRKKKTTAAAKKKPDEEPAPKPKASAPRASAPRASAPKPAIPSVGAPPPPPLNTGGWDNSQGKLFYFDEKRQAHRYLMDPADPLSLSGPLSAASMTQILTSDYGMPKKAATRVMENFRILNGELLDPSQPPGPRLVGGNTTPRRRYVYNFYRPLHIQPRAGKWDNIRALLSVLVGGEAAALEWFLDWLAAPLQALIKLKKTLKLRTSVALSGLPGAGKGTLEALIRLLYGDAYVVTISQDILDSPYQAELMHKLFVVADEVQAHDKAAVARLKRLVTAKEVEINQKYVARTTAPNLAQYLFTTNDDVPVRVEQGDRRFSVFFTSAPDPSITRAVWADIEGAQDEVAAFQEFLLNRTITHNLDKPFENEARDDVQLSSLKPHQSFVREVRQFGLHTAATPWKDGEKMNRPRQVTLTPDSTKVLSSTLVEIYQAWARVYGGRHNAGAPAAIIARLKKEGLIGEPKRCFVGPEKLSYYDGIPLYAPADVDEILEIEEPVVPPTPADTKLKDLPFGAS